MRVITEGKLRGSTVELQEATGLPEGLHVRVILDTEPLPLAERKRRVADLCGAWQSDTSLPGVFGQIETERR